MLAAQSAKWCAVDPLRQKFTAEEKKAWTKAERAMYKSAYELGGEARATMVLRRYFAEQKAASGGDGGGEAGDGSAGAEGSQTAAVGAGSSAGAPAAAPGVGAEAASAVATTAATSEAVVASKPVIEPPLVPLLPRPLSDLQSGRWLIAGSAAWEDVGKRALSSDEAMPLSSFHCLLPSVAVSLVLAAPSACHLIALTPTGQAYALGRNSNGQLGLGHTSPTSKPALLEVPAPSTAPADATNAAAASAGGRGGARVERFTGGAVGKAHTLLLTARGALYSCGSNAAGQLGQAMPAKQGKFVPAPKQVAWPRSAQPPAHVACGADFCVATDADGKLYSWGHPQYGQLGNGTSGEHLERSGRVDYQFRTEPMAVPNAAASSAAAAPPMPLPPIGAIACGDHHSLALSTAGTVFCWGFGGYGRLGLSDQNDRYRPTSVPFSHGAKLVDVKAGGTCSYAVSRSGGVWFWGRTKSTGEATMYPKGVSDLHGWAVRSLACGHTSSFVAADRTLISWGPSPCYGELGYGKDGPGSSTAPKFVDELEGAVVEHVAAGYACSSIIVSTADEQSRAVLAKMPSYEEALEQKLASAKLGGGAGKGKLAAGKKGGKSKAQAAAKEEIDENDDDDDEEEASEDKSDSAGFEGSSSDDDDDGESHDGKQNGGKAMVGKKRPAPAKGASKPPTSKKVGKAGTRK